MRAFLRPSCRSFRSSGTALFSQAFRRQAANPDEPSTYNPDDTADASAEDLFGGPMSVGVGLICLSGGIILINLNERRAKKQDDLNDFCESKIVSLNEDEVKPNNIDEVAGKIIHAHGDLKAQQPWPRDGHLAVEEPEMLRLRRNVRMYQWEETKHEETDKDTKEKKVWYTYQRKWADQHLSTHDGRNPSFPHMPSVSEAGMIQMFVNALVLLFSPNFVERLNEFQPLNNVNTTDNGSCALRHNLELLPNKSGFYTRGHSIEHPDIGDVHVTYSVVRPAPYTVLGKYDGILGITPFKASLSQSLASQGEILIPKEAHDVAKGVGYPSLTAPAWLVEGVEGLLLSAAPLEFAHLELEHQTKSVACAHHRRHHEDMTVAMYWVGSAVVVLGCMLLASPASTVVSGTVVGSAGMATGMGIAVATQKAAQDQVRGPNWKTPNTATRPGGPKKGDVAL
jgi:hypothetical protein